MLYSLLRFRTVVFAVMFALLLTAGSPLGAAHTFAQEAATADSEICTSCHSEEGDAWKASPHAVADPNAAGLPGGASCVDCHGPYVRGHPDTGTIQLSITSELCQSCHTGTYNQWAESVHAQAGVPCTGCHLVHSQTLRLSDETLCLSCHRDTVGDNFHLSHQLSDVTCTECHLAPSTSPSVTTAAGGETVVTIPAPNHDFVATSSERCVACHRQYIGDGQVTTSLAASDMTPAKLVALADRVPELTAKVNAEEAEKRSLAATAVIALGLGIGVGGVLGIIFVLAVGFVVQRRSSK